MLEKVYDIWTNVNLNKEELRVNLKKMAHILYGISFFDAVFIIEKHSFGLEHGKVSEGFLESGHVLEKYIGFYLSHQEIISDFVYYFTPKPMGVFSAFLGLYISHIINNDKMKLYRNLST